MEQSHLAKLMAFVAILSLVVAYLAWQFPKTAPQVVQGSAQGSLEGETRATPPAAPKPQGAQEQSPEPKSLGPGIAGPTRRTAPEPTAPEQPIEFVLRDGQQEVVLDGRVSVAAEFFRFGEMDTATVHLKAEGEEQQNRSSVEQAKRIEFNLSGVRYAASILEVDSTSRTIRIRIDSLH